MSEPPGEALVAAMTAATVQAPEANADISSRDTEAPQERRLQIATLTDRFEVALPKTACLRDIREIIRRDRGLRGPIALALEDGQRLRDDEPVGNFPEGATLCCAAISLEALESRLAQLESPGCRYQKYLRSYEGVPASDQRVQRTFWALAVLRQTAEHVHSDPTHAHAIPLNQVAAAAIMMLDRIWGMQRFDDDEITPSDHDLLLSPDEPVTDKQRKLFERMSANELEMLVSLHYSFEAHERLLSYVLESPDGAPCEEGQRSPRLRVALAELYQITCRGTTELLRPKVFNARQSQAYIDLLKIVSCHPNARCWA